MATMTTSGSAKLTFPSDTQIVITREFAAPKHLVYRAVTDARARQEMVEREARRGDDVRDRPPRRRQVALRHGRPQMGSRSPSTASTERSFRTSGSLRPKRSKGLPDPDDERNGEHHDPRPRRRSAPRRSPSRSIARTSSCATRSSSPAWKQDCRMPTISWRKSLSLSSSWFIRSKESPGHSRGSPFRGHGSLLMR